MKRFLFLLLFLLPLLVGAASPPEEITFCAYNLRNYVRMERYSKGQLVPDQPKPEKEITAVVKFLADIKPDVLGVSEIGQEQELLDLQSRLKAAGLDLPNTEYCHGGDPVRRIALLTHFPIKQRNSQTELHYQIGDEVFPVQRGFLDVVLEPRGGLEMHFVGVHLKSKRPVPEADQSLMRRNEARLLREHLDKIFAEHPDERLLVYGDCNEDAREPAILDIAGAQKAPGALHQVHVHDERGETWTHFWKEMDLYSRLDYFFVSPAMSRLIDHKGCRIYDAPDYYTGSDHRPIVARIKLKAASR
jgi:endonuclease/exonuclease/phosphatase family metal-dependent hydrolase